RRSVLLLTLFFFFQAEDGIRDRNVTGVQTCALPISPAAHARRGAAGTGRPSPGAEVERGAHARHGCADRGGAGLAGPPRGRVPRSEERRGGKGRRSRWWQGGGENSRKGAGHERAIA